MLEAIIHLYLKAPSIMTTNTTKPPAHVWEKIEKILDEQEFGRNHTKKLIIDSFPRSRNARRTNFFITTVTGVSLLTLIMLKYSHTSKNNHLN